MNFQKNQSIDFLSKTPTLCLKDVFRRVESRTICFFLLYQMLIDFIRVDVTRCDYIWLITRAMREGLINHIALHSVLIEYQELWRLWRVAFLNSPRLHLVSESDISILPRLLGCNHQKKKQFPVHKKKN